MTDSSNRTIYLLSQYAADLCTAAEADELFDIIKASQEDETLHRFLEEEWIKLLPAVEKEPDWNRIYQGIISRPGVVYNRPQADDATPGVSFESPQADDRQHGVSRSGPRVVQMFSNKTFRWVAAASVIIIASLIVILNLSKSDNGTKPTVATTHDVPAPNNTRAVITLADGRKVYLDSVSNGTIAQENNVNVIKAADGKIIYQGALTTGHAPITYNTLSNPRGSKVIDMTLSDGSHVWLNAGSSITYPVAFIGKERSVEMTGEAYFEVKHNSKQPFKVHLPNGSIVEDIGTSFNVNAYPDENATKTTLIEGSVRVFANSQQLTANGPSIVLRPNQQSVQIPQTRVIRVQNNVDMDEVLAWKNGSFSFKSTDLKTMMRQIARWYDVEVNYEGDVANETISGEISRNVNVSQVMKMLEFAGIHFRVEGKKITVMK